LSGTAEIPFVSIIDEGFLYFKGGGVMDPDLSDLNLNGMNSYIGLKKGDHNFAQVKNIRHHLEGRGQVVGVES
jgi:hypothetical protein